MTAAPAPFEAIVFDLDGTLLATQDLITATVDRVLEAQGHPPVAAELVYAMIGLPLEAMFERFLPPESVDLVPESVILYRAIFDTEVVPAVQAFPGTAELLASVAGSGTWPLGVATGRRTETAIEMLTRTGLVQHFASILGTDLVSRPKPHPDVLLTVLRRMGGFNAERTLVVGDSVHDITMARAAGAAVCAVTWGAESAATLQSAWPDWCIDTWPELLGLLQLGAD